MDRYLFRGKRLDNGELVIGFYYRTSNGTRIHEVQDEIPFCLESNVHLVDPATVGQCAGLKDKNGKLIFEGDILKNNSQMYAVVIWSEEFKGMWQLKYLNKIGKGYAYPIAEEYWNGWEIVGNVHDSPELLENGATA